MQTTRLQHYSKLLTWAELGLGFFLILISIYLFSLDFHNYWISFIILVAASAFAYHIKVDFPFARISQAYSVNFLSVLVLGPWTGSLVAAIGVTLGDGIFLHKRKYAMGVNAAVQFITTFLTGTVYYMLGGIGEGVTMGFTENAAGVATSEEFIITPSVQVFAPLICAAIIHTFVNISLLVPAMIAEGRSIPHTTLLKLGQWDLISTFLFTPLSFYIFLIYGSAASYYLIPPLLFLLLLWVFVQNQLDLNLAKSQLDLTVDRLRKLTQISKAINAAGLNPEEILDIVLVNGMMVCGATAAAIRLLDPSPGGEVAELSRPDSDQWKKFFQSSSFQLIVDHIHGSRQSLLVEEFRVDNIGTWFHPAIIEKYNIRSFLAFPILREDQMEGLLFFAGDQSNMFTATHIETLEYLSGEIAIAIRNARIHHRITLQNARKDEEIKLAERVQRHVLPRIYEGGNVRIEGRITPARILSGDFFDVIELDNDRLGIAMGDVSGKGVPASLTMMAIINSIRVLAHKIKKPNEMLKALNESLYESEAAIEDFLQYSTGFYAILDKKTWAMTYSIAGCEKPLWWISRRKMLTKLEGEGLPLGMFENSKYRVDIIRVEPGDKLIFYTDGVTDAQNPDGQRFGREAFMSSVEKACLRSVDNIIDTLLDDVHKFSSGAEPFDDIGIMAVEILNPRTISTREPMIKSSTKLPLEANPVKNNESSLFQA
ncbi:MAG TPA: SpoIIE family protein phosphatase [bacterium]|jgi:sigma-B regulation protein RsbU (phosphoserine phosphatase)